MLTKESTQLQNKANPSPNLAKQLRVSERQLIVRDRKEKKTLGVRPIGQNKGPTGHSQNSVRNNQGGSRAALHQKKKEKKQKKRNQTEYKCICEEGKVITKNQPTEKRGRSVLGEVKIVSV